MKVPTREEKERGDERRKREKTRGGKEKGEEERRVTKRIRRRNFSYVTSV